MFDRFLAIAILARESTLHGRVHSGCWLAEACDRLLRIFTPVVQPINLTNVPSFMRLVGSVEHRTLSLTL